MVGQLGLLVAFLAGLASFLSPCVLPLVPVYLSYLGGTAASARGDSAGAGGVATAVSAQRAVLARNALGFVLGFGLVFVALGLAAGLIGRGLAGEQRLLARLGGVAVILFGLMLVGWLRPAWASRELRLAIPTAQPGLGGSVLFGAVFGFAWTPCIGPTLGAILTLALSAGGTGRAAILLAAYTAGLATPLLAAALLAGRSAPVLRALARYSQSIQTASGILLIAVGILLVLGLFSSLAQFLAGLTYIPPL